MNKSDFQSRIYSAAHRDRMTVSIKLQMIAFCALMFIAGFAFGDYLSAAEAARVVSALTK